MPTSETIEFFIAVMAWDVFCLQLLIIPFLRKDEALHKDYITNGALGAARSSIEEKKLMPALAKMFVRIREAQVGRKLKLEEEEVQAILQEVDYVPYLDVAQEAMEESNALKGLFDSLQEAAERIWRFGLLHAIIMLCLPTSQWMPGGYDLIAMITAIIFAVITLVVAIFKLMLFKKQMRCFLGSLEQNR